MKMETRPPYEPIADYGIIGDCHTAALVSCYGSIDWYSPRRFDEPAVFCRLLDSRAGGYFMVVPEGEFNVRRSYMGDTNILQTTFITGKGTLRLTDFMPVHERESGRRGYDVGTSRRILRLLECESGEITAGILIKPAFNFSRGETLTGLESKGFLVAHQDGSYMSLACPGFDPGFKPAGKGEFTARFALQQGDQRWLVLTEADDPDRVRELPGIDDCRLQLERSRQYWQAWSSKCTYQGPYRDKVLRSALTLKLLTYEPTGAIIAAPTTSLPEEIGGERNWDYRYSWVRDSALILYALMNVGYREEAADFFEWLLETHRLDSSPDLQVLYRIDGGREVSESVLDQLEGYRKSRPVRIGNAAAKQLQLDIYGEALTAANLYFSSEIGKRAENEKELQSTERILEDDWPFLRGLVERTVLRWIEPDDGIWEVRGGPRPFLYSRLMCWAAIDRGIRLAETYKLEAPLEKWQKARDGISSAILREGFNSELSAFTQYFGSTDLDASALLIPRTGFLPATDARVQSTIEQIKSRLLSGNLVYRYLANDGLHGKEGAFATCSFWLVDALALSGRLDEARDLFEKVSGYANELGLLSEELYPGGEMVGNFPQGFTHMALINAAINLEKAKRHGPEHEPENEAQRAEKAGKAVMSPG